VQCPLCRRTLLEDDAASLTSSDGNLRASTTDFSHAHLLSIGDHPSLLHSRSMVLSQAGFNVEEKSSNQVLAEPYPPRRKPLYDLALICQSVPAHKCLTLARVIHSANRAKAVMALSVTDELLPSAEIEMVFEAPISPQDLLNAVRGQLR
jgi:DNA-binding response OmpR family regulator